MHDKETKTEKNKDSKKPYYGYLGIRQDHLHRQTEIKYCMW